MNKQNAANQSFSTEKSGHKTDMEDKKKKRRKVLSKPNFLEKGDEQLKFIDRELKK